MERGKDYEIERLREENERCTRWVAEEAQKWGEAADKAKHRMAELKAELATARELIELARDTTDRHGVYVELDAFLTKTDKETST